MLCVYECIKKCYCVCVCVFNGSLEIINQSGLANASLNFTASEEPGGDSLTDPLGKVGWGRMTAILVGRRLFHPSSSLDPGLCGICAPVLLLHAALPSADGRGRPPPPPAPPPRPEDPLRRHAQGRGARPLRQRLRRQGLSVPDHCLHAIY